MNKKIESFIIMGITREGKTFRPSDWADRLCGILSAFDQNNRTTYSPYVRPGCNLTGQKAVIVDARLNQIDPLAYKFVVDFANDNNLQVEPIDDDQV
jgi:hypothetical protein